MGRDAGREAAGLAPVKHTTIAVCKTPTAEAKAWADAELDRKRKQAGLVAGRKGSLAAAFAKARQVGKKVLLTMVYYQLAIFFYAANIAFAVSENTYFRAALDTVWMHGAQTGWDQGVAAGIAATRPGASQADKEAAESYPQFQPPTWQGREQFRTTHLRTAVKEMNDFNGRLIEHTAAVCAGTYVSDGWRDGLYRMEQINEFLLTALGCVFIQAVFTAMNGKTGEYLAEVMTAGLKKAEAMGAVVRFVITDGAANAKECGRLVELAFAMIFFYVCAAHGLDLAMEDMGKLAFIKDTLRDALAVITFVLSYEKFFAIFTEHADLKLMKPAATRFGYAYLVLWTLMQDKAALKKAFADPRTEAWIEGTQRSRNTARMRSRREKFNTINDTIVNSSRFWDNVTLCLAVMEPFWLCLRQLDAATATLSKAAILIHAAVARVCADSTISAAARRGVEDVFYGANGRLNYILTPLHLAAPFFDPQFHPLFGTGEKPKKEWRKHILPVMQRYFGGDSAKAAECYGQFVKYESAVIVRGDDGEIIGGYDDSVMACAATVHPAEWHRDFTLPWAPLFGQFAADMCGAYACTSAAERLHKDFGRVHTSDRNALSAARVFDLASLRNYLRLKAQVAEAGWQLSFMEWTAEREVLKRLDDVSVMAEEREAALRATCFDAGSRPKSFMAMLMDSDDEEGAEGEEGAQAEAD